MPGPTIKIAQATKKREKEVDDFLQSQRLFDVGPSGDVQRPRQRPEDAPKDEWQRLARLENGSPSKFEKQVPRLPKLHDFYLTLAHDAEEKQSMLSQLYGEKNVRALDQRGDIFLVRKLDKKTGDEKYFRTDEKGVTMRDATDVLGGLVSLAPEIGGYVAATSGYASKFPQHPFTKLGLLGLQVAGMAGGEAAGAVKDIIVRKAFDIDPRYGEIAGRRGLNFAIGVPAGVALGKFAGGGKLKPNELKQLGKMREADPSLLKEDIHLTSDELIAKYGQGSAERQMIEQTAATSTLDPAIVRTQKAGEHVLKRIPFIEDPTKRATLSGQRAAATMRRELVGTPDFPAMGQQVRRAVQTGEKQARHWSQGLGAESVSEAEAAVIKGGIPTVGKTFEAQKVGDKLRSALAARKEQMESEATALYQGVEDDLAEEGVGQFIRFKNLANEVKEWRKRLPKIATPEDERRIIKESPILGPTGAKQVIRSEARKPFGEFDEASKQAEVWIKLADDPQTLQEAQTAISALGELSRAGTMGSKEVGSIGFAGGALNKFYSAAKQDLSEAFDALARRGKISKDLKDKWLEANMAHLKKVDALNKSKYVQSALRSGREGGREVESAELIKILANGDTANLKLMKEMLNPSEYEELRTGILKEMVGLNDPIKIMNSTDLPFRSSGSGILVQKGGELEVVDLRQLIGHFSKPGNKGFLRAVFEDGPKGEKVKALQASLDDYQRMMELHKGLGKSRGIKADELDDIIRELDQGNPTTARKIMRAAVEEEKKRGETYLDLLGEAYKKGDFDLIEAAPQEFVDKIILGGGARSAKFGKALFKELPEDVQNEVRRHTAERIIARSTDIGRTPVKYLNEGKGLWVPNEAAYVKIMYGDPSRQKMIKEMFPPEDYKILEDFAQWMQVISRENAVAGGAGRMAVETMFGLGDPLHFASRGGAAKLVTSDLAQDFLSKGAADKTSMNHLIRFMMRNKKGKEATAADATREAAYMSQMGIFPKKLQMTMALSIPTVEEKEKMLDLGHRLFAWAIGTDKKEFKALTGLNPDDAPSSLQEIDDFLDRELNKKQGK